VIDASDRQVQAFPEDRATKRRLAADACLDSTSKMLALIVGGPFGRNIGGLTAEALLSQDSPWRLARASRSAFRQYERSAEMSQPDYLHRCAALQPELLKRLSGRAQHLDAVERAVAKVRSSRGLTHEALMAIVGSPDFAAAQMYWSWPTAEEMQTALGAEELDLWNLPKNERAVVKKLRTVFKTFEAVSVVLRFVAPEHYGILSTPVENLLGVQPSSESIDRYLSYLGDLRLIKEKRRFASTAQVDQALWTLQVGVYGKRLDKSDVDSLKAAHRQDRLLKEIRVRHLADALFATMSRLDLAEALATDMPDIASPLIAIEFEQAVRAYARAPRPNDDLGKIIAEKAPSHLHGEWQRGRRLRNRAAHGETLNQKEADELVRTTRGVLELLAARRRR
jgi:hypothetical protein